jgi:diamine N-acetyltransferase
MANPELLIELREARRDEVQAVRRLARVIWHAHYPGIIAIEQIDYMLERGYATEALEGFLGRPERGLELALVDGEPAGFAAWYVLEGTGEVKLDKLYVLQSRQRLGLGRRLIDRVAERARALGTTTLILNVNKNNTQAIHAYERNGFAVREAVVNDIGNGFVMDDYVMARSLRTVAGLPPSPAEATIKR